MRHFLSVLTPIVIVLGLVVPEMRALAQGYIVQIGDRLEVSVLEDPGLGRTVLVRPDGRITMPLAGVIDAAGSSPEAVQARIRDALSDQFVQPPTVTVSVVSLGEGVPQAVEEGRTIATVYVLGEVGRPGDYQIALPMDVLQLLAIAGGPSTFAARSRIQVRRRSAEGESVFLLDYDTIERGIVPSTEIMIADGDVIIVPERRLFE